MKSLIVISLASVFLLGAVACHHGGSSSVNPDPGGMFGDDPVATQATVCHVPEGVAEGAYTLVIAANDLTTHLSHGDTEGECVTDGPPVGDDDDDDAL